MKILFWDTETAPMLAHIWHPADDYVHSDRLIHGSFLLAWSAKWAGERRVHTGVLSSKEAVAQNDSRIAAELADLIREADIIVAHNGDRYDVPVLNGRLLQLGLEPLGPVQTIDTLKLSKRNFRLPYHKLDALSEMLLGERKLKTSFSLWADCYHGDEKALGKMVRYCAQDTKLLERVFEAMTPYVRGLTRLVDGEGRICPFCGSTKLTARGYYRTQASTFQKLRCDGCGKYSRERKAEAEKLAVHPL